jgi:hypothetical protein
MRKIRDVLRLKFEVQLSHEKIAAATGVSKGAVTNTVQRAAQKGLSWPLPADLDDSRLEALLYAQAAPHREYALPDYALIHQELKRKGVTLQLLWEEYEAAYGERGYRYSQFCAHYHEYRGTLARSMRQVHRTDESRKPLHYRLGGIPGHVRAEQPVIFSGIRSHRCQSPEPAANFAKYGNCV